MVVSTFRIRMARVRFSASRPSMSQSSRAYHRKWYKENKERLADSKNARVAKRRKFLKRIVDQIKLICGCRVCGYDKHHSALCFHHREPETKSFDICTGIASVSVLTLLAEIAKCDVLCANCHAIHHSLEI
jgi:hypothetical protein